MKLFCSQLSLLLGLTGFATGCRQASTQGTLVLTQVPTQHAASTEATDRPDQRYPPGTRIVAVDPGRNPSQARVLSVGLLAAGNPRLSPAGDEILFCGKATPSATWQIYRTSVNGGQPQQITDFPGGAVDPAWLPDGRLAFCAPAPQARAPSPMEQPRIYVMPLSGGPVEQLSHAARSVSDLTVLQDGRILFVGELPAGTRGLFTMNSDGTEVAGFGALHDDPGYVARPRELSDGRVVFLARSAREPTAPERLDQLETAHPFSSRQTVNLSVNGIVRSAEPGLEDPILLALRPAPSPLESPASFAIYALTDPAAPPKPLFDDPAWDDIEAVQCAPRSKPMGRLSTIDRELDFGRILCLDANLVAGTRLQEPQSLARRVRFLAWDTQGAEEILGESLVQSDGSFLVEVPADRVLGLETLDANGQVLHRLEPSIWVRPGENRSCIGCHETHNSSPRNTRPMASRFPATRIGLPTQTAELAQTP